MKWEKLSWARAIILLAASCLLAATVTLRHAQAAHDPALHLSGYTSHSERVTEYLFNGSEDKYVWV